MSLCLQTSSPFIHGEKRADVPTNLSAANSAQRYITDTVRTPKGSNAPNSIM